MTQTDENLRTAFAGESQANRRYLAFAQKADEEGKKQVARLFRAAADAETVHAINHLRVMGGIKSTEENLNAAIIGETHEFTEMYPTMARVAGEEANEEARASFSKANEVEKVHANLYQEALAAVKSGKDLDETDIYVCQVCGNTVKDKAPDKCPICGQPKKVFRKIE
jgi:rubrerythrin